MARLIKRLLVLALTLLPAAALGAEAKPFKHVMSVYGEDKEMGLKSPEGIACNAKLEFVVGDTGNGRLLRYTLLEDKVVAGPQLKIPELPSPIRLQLTSKGEILALDGKVRRIGRVNAAGAFAGYVAPTGVPGSQKVLPRSFKVDSLDNLYVLDLAGARVLQLDAAGKYVRQIPFPEKGGTYADLAISPEGSIYLVDPSMPQVYVATKGSANFVPFAKDLKSYAAFPTYLTVDSQGLLYLVDQFGDAVVTLAMDGSFVARRLTMGWKDGQVNYPSQVCIGGGNTLFLADRGNNKVQIFQIEQ